MDAVSVHARYETATRKVDNEYLTRREYNIRFQHYDNPIPEVPEAGQHLWNWFFDIDDRMSRITDGVCARIPPSEWLAWQQMTREIVYPREYDILAAMDRAYCAAVNVEIAAGRALERKD